MAKGFNKVIIMGNLTRDPELRTTPNGQSVCGFSVAVNRTWRNADGEQQEAVDYFDCNAWGKAGEIISQYMQKGRPILVSGRLQSRSWEQDGQKRSKVEIVVEDFNFVGDGGGRGGDGGLGGSLTARSASADEGTTDTSKKSTKKNVKDDMVIEDIDDQPVDLSDIPF